jgi:hypothetical protein
VVVVSLTCSNINRVPALCICKSVHPPCATRTLFILGGIPHKMFRPRHGIGENRYTIVDVLTRGSHWPSRSERRLFTLNLSNEIKGVSRQDGYVVKIRVAGPHPSRHSREPRDRRLMGDRLGSGAPSVLTSTSLHHRCHDQRHRHIIHMHTIHNSQSG